MWSNLVHFVHRQMLDTPVVPSWGSLVRIALEAAKTHELDGSVETKSIALSFASRQIE